MVSANGCQQAISGMLIAEPAIFGLLLSSLIRPSSERPYFDFRLRTPDSESHPVSTLFLAGQKAQSECVGRIKFDPAIPRGGMVRKDSRTRANSARPQFRAFSPVLVRTGHHSVTPAN
jgi:hypothetical protein